LLPFADQVPEGVHECGGENEEDGGESHGYLYLRSQAFCVV
jgi:hypothetical protein